MTENHFSPDWMSPPGATLASILTKKKVSIEDLAKALGVSVTRSREMLAGRSAITIGTAKLLQRHFGGSTDFWMKREEQFRDDLARLSETRKKDAHSIWLSRLPISDMVRFGWIESTNTTDDRVNACLHFFGVNSIEEWRRAYRDTLSAVSFRTSLAYEPEPGAVLAWLRYGEIQAEKAETTEWSADRLRQALPDIRRLTRGRDPDRFIPELQALCAAAGVAVIVARHPKGCRASGATRFISNTKAMLLLSFRYLSDDQFWFTLFHEIGHLLLHDRRALFLEDGSDVSADEESEANQFAGDVLIPLELRAQLPKRPIRRKDIQRAAVRLELSRGVVVGQMQHLGRLDREQFNWLKRRFRWAGTRLEATGTE